MKRILIAGNLRRTSSAKTGIFSSAFEKTSIGFRLKSLAKGNGIYLLLGGFLLIGMVIGAISARNAGYDTLLRFDLLFSSNFAARKTQSLFLTFTASFAASFLFVLLCFLAGLSLWGAFLSPLIPLFRGYGMGCSAGYLYAFYSLRGVLFYLLVLLPGFFLSALAIIIGTRESIRFSATLIFSTKPEASSERLKGDLRLYMKRTCVILIVILISAAIDVFLTACFSGLLEF